MFLLSVSWRGALTAMLSLLQMVPKATVVCDMTMCQGAAASSSSCNPATCDMVSMLQQLRNTSMLFNQTLNTEFFDDWATSFDIRLSTVTTLTDTGNSGASTLLSHPYNHTHTHNSSVGTPFWLPLGAYITCGKWDAWVWALAYVQNCAGWHQPFIEKPYGTDVSLRVAHTHNSHMS